MNNPPTGIVTFLFTDIEGSTKLAQEFPESLPLALEKHHSILKEALESNNGFVFSIFKNYKVLARRLILPRNLFLPQPKSKIFPPGKILRGTHNQFPKYLTKKNFSVVHLSIDTGGFLRVVFITVSTVGGLFCTFIGHNCISCNSNYEKTFSRVVT